MNLEEFFNKHRKVALAFSGGVDSAYLLYSAIKNNVDVCAYYVKSDFQPDFELEDAKRLRDILNANMKILNIEVLENPNISKNPEDRCYYCKKEIFGKIYDEARKDGYEVLLDGTNFSDEYEDRPGMKAKDELKVLSPLRECELTKEDIRKLSKEAGLFTWNKPSYSCLATRIKTYSEISKEKLERTEKSEEFMRSLGFTDFRVRNMGDDAKIEVISSEFELLFKNREKILRELSKYFNKVLLDLEAR
ncbi:ATP-dependent sacrificial sulfur transferase LarE [Peptoniphilus sp.]|jgi:uncharacterized protein|uniref:ATP-dependent sacrificial sulfur transferase LarE n=1 Tax=Peptoniphilus sp. TaxID=1971214 RepID=UPI003D8F7AB7